jgi:hypothetical protein
LIWAKSGLGYILGDFFTNSSGHSGCELERFDFNSETLELTLQAMTGQIFSFESFYAASRKIFI